MRTFRHPPKAPRKVSFTAAEPSYESYGWRVRINRPAMEFSTLLNAGVHGFALVGSGRISVITPRLFRPRSEHLVTIRSEAGRRSIELRANGKGRLRVAVPLGPGNALPQYSPGAAPSRFFQSTVSIRRGAK
jgi:hypothetical protein